MKNLKTIVGMMGEELACNYLRHKGYRILDRNFTGKSGEIDIIAFKNQTIVFVEVKTRKNEDYAYASQSINAKKIRNIRATSNHYLIEKSYYDFDYRYDLIELYYQTKTINHIIDAF